MKTYMIENYRKRVLSGNEGFKILSEELDDKDAFLIWNGMDDTDAANIFVILSRDENVRRSDSRKNNKKTSDLQDIFFNMLSGPQQLTLLKTIRRIHPSFDLRKYNERIKHTDRSPSGKIVAQNSDFSKHRSVTTKPAMAFLNYDGTETRLISSLQSQDDKKYNKYECSSHETIPSKIFFMIATKSAIFTETELTRLSLTHAPISDKTQVSYYISDAIDLQKYTFERQQIVYLAKIFFSHETGIHGNKIEIGIIVPDESTQSYCVSRYSHISGTATIDDENNVTFNNMNESNLMEKVIELNNISVVVNGTSYEMSFNEYISYLLFILWKGNGYKTDKSDKRIIDQKLNRHYEPNVRNGQISERVRELISIVKLAIENRDEFMDFLTNPESSSSMFRGIGDFSKMDCEKIHEVYISQTAGGTRKKKRKTKRKIQRSKRRKHRSQKKH